MFSSLLTMPSFQASKFLLQCSRTGLYGRLTEPGMGDAVTNSTRKGWLTAILELGAWFGSLYAGFIADILSLRYSILLSTTIFIVGVVVQCTATINGSAAILGSRFITGTWTAPS